jgi:hypothetical protein
MLAEEAAAEQAFVAAMDAAVAAFVVAVAKDVGRWTVQDLGPA